MQFILVPRELSEIQTIHTKNNGEKTQILIRDVLSNNSTVSAYVLVAPLKYSSALIRELTVKYIMHSRCQHNSPQILKHGTNSLLFLHLTSALITVLLTLSLLQWRDFFLSSITGRPSQYERKMNEAWFDILFIHSCTPCTETFKGEELMMPDDSCTILDSYQLKRYCQIDSQNNATVF